MHLAVWHFTVEAVRLTKVDVFVRCNEIVYFLKAVLKILFQANH